MQEVYEIAAWLPGGAVMRSTDRDGRHPEYPGRIEFVGKVATDNTQRKYVGKSVRHYFPKGAVNPIRYVNCGISSSRNHA